jgi:surface polysaccharide O-acyltransferase-like enzyme
LEKDRRIDFLRVASAVAVVLIHVLSIYDTGFAYGIDVNIIRTVKTCSVLMRWAVPMFMMITGFCLMQKPICSYSYCFAHICKYICALFTVGLFYALLEEVFTTRTFGVLEVLHALQCVIAGNIWEHMWYVYWIIGLYIIMPVIHCYFHQSDRGCIFFTGILFVFGIILYTLNKVYPIGIQLPIDGYLFYICFGCLMAKYKDKLCSKWTVISLIVFCISVLFVVVNLERFSFGYKHPIICLMSMSLFCFVIKSHATPHIFISRIAQYTWPIYLIHPLFINIFYKVFKLNLLQGNPYCNLLVFAILVFTMSLLISIILRKIPWIKRIF